MNYELDNLQDLHSDGGATLYMQTYVQYKIMGIVYHAQKNAIIIIHFTMVDKGFCAPMCASKAIGFVFFLTRL